MKKSGLSIMLALGKKPTAGDPSDEADNPVDDGADNAPAEPSATDEPEDDSSAARIPLPKGFKPPQDATDGEPFTTTVRGKIVDGEFEVEAIGDMPLNGGESGESPDEEAAESPQEEATEDEDPMHAQMLKEYSKKKSADNAARNAFQR